MGELWRSEPMTLLQFVIPTDDAHDVVFDLGNLGVVQFKDLNPDINTFQRNFVNEILRIDELQRKLRYFEEQLKKTGRHIPEVFEKAQRLKPLGPQEIPEMENFFEETERELQQMNDGFEAITQNIKTHEEHVRVLQRYEAFVSEYESDGGYAMSGAFLGVKSGVIATDRVHTFERILWRATKGNIFLRSADLKEESEEAAEPTEQTERKSMFMIMYKEGEHLANCVEKLCQAFGTSLYDCPDNFAERQAALSTAQQQIQELKEVLRYNQERHTSLLNTLYENIQQWRDDLLREKAIYHILNQFRFDSRRLTLLAEGWCPTSNVREVAAILQRQGKLPIIVRQITPENETPPTYFRTNKFTQTFQDIVDAYGVAGYQEINPAVFTIITFPFLFAVMFGDVGHGLLMLIFSLWMLKNEQEMLRQNLGEMLSMLFTGRYVITMMALFSIFTGFMYNEAFGVSMALFPSGWVTNGTLVMVPRGDYVYPFGVDSYWHTAVNSLYFYNSLKMKMSVLMGVTQMCLGIVLSAGNAVYFRKPYNFWFEFMPQIFFMCSLFGYLCLLVIIKWFTVFDTTTPPGLLNVFLQMFLSPMNFDKEMALYPGQHGVQVVLLVIGLLCVPLMLFPKPFLLRRDHMQHVPQKKKGFTQFDNEGDLSQPNDSVFAGERNTLGVRTSGSGEPSEEGEVVHDHEEFEFTEIFIEQVIHTIEFVLGAISNTASYLRLWALSLAHAQLSSVFYKTVFVKTLVMCDPVAIFIGFGVWGGLTFAVLMIMESLSAFLHALRLHWVEFQNKFYHGDGKAFHPFNFREFDEYVV